MKKLLALLLCLMLLCSAAMAESTYTNPAYGATFQYADGWAVAGESDAHVIMVGYDEQYTAMMYITEIGMEMSLDQLLTAFPTVLADYQASYPDNFTVQDAGSICQVGEREFVYMMCSFDMDGTPVVMRKYAAMEGTNLYEFTFLAESALLEDAAVTAEIESAQTALLSSFAVGAPAENIVVAEDAQQLAQDAPAAEVEGAISYTHAAGGYSFSYPADMIVKDKENVQALLDEMTDEDYDMAGLDESVLQAQAEQIRQTDMVMVETDDSLFNFNVVYQNSGMNLTNELILSAYCPVFKQQYQAIYPELTMLDEGSLYTAGDNTFVTQSLAVTANGIPMTIVVLYAVNGTYLYNLTFTTADFAIADAEFEAYVNSTVELVASTFAATEPAAQ